jgi:SAM-dependent methyltransferase
MIENDVKYIKKLLESRLLYSPCLELGTGYEGETNRNLLQSAGLSYFGTDIVSGNNVDYVVDFEDSTQVGIQFNSIQFNSILVLNVLEHTFDPIRVLDNVFSILAPNGTCVIITPTVWPLHDYPFDCWRINPNFYEQYCKRRGLNLLYEYFEYIGFNNVKESLDASRAYCLPKPAKSKFQLMKSKVTHKLFNTFGRGMFFPSHVATGCIIRKGLEKL